MARRLLNKDDLKDKLVHVRLADYEYDELKMYCKRNGIRPSDVIRQAINMIHIKQQCGMYQKKEYLEMKKNQKRKGKSLVVSAKVRGEIFRQLIWDSFNVGTRKTELLEDAILEVIRK